MTVVASWHIHTTSTRPKVAIPQWRGSTFSCDCRTVVQRFTSRKRTSAKGNSPRFPHCFEDGQRGLRATRIKTSCFKPVRKLALEPLHRHGAFLRLLCCTSLSQSWSWLGAHGQGYFHAAVRSRSGEIEQANNLKAEKPLNDTTRLMTERCSSVSNRTAVDMVKDQRRS